MENVESAPFADMLASADPVAQPAEPPQELLRAELESTLPPGFEFDPVSLAARHDGWTRERQRAFIEELADCGIVKEAAARVGKHERSAYSLRRRPDAAGFNRAWDAAVQLGVDRLQSTAFERAVAGTVKRRYYQGEVVAEERVFDNRLLMFLLSRLDQRRSYDHTRTIANWTGSMDALEDGLPAPLPEPDEDDDPPVWRDEDGEWLTDFAPPEGFSGDQDGCFGDEDYCRSLTADEQHAVEAWQARIEAQEALRRERYFARLRGEVQPEVQSTLS